jgi:hypothetical protein
MYVGVGTFVHLFHFMHQASFFLHNSRMVSFYSYSLQNAASSSIYRDDHDDFNNQNKHHHHHH